MDDLRVLLDLLEIPSPSGQEEAACRWFAEHAVRLGYRVARDTVGNVVASLGEGSPRVMFLGHIDTVPGTWPVRIEDGTVHARGAVDAKGPLAAGLLAAARLGEGARGTRTVVAAVGEETDSRGALELLRGPAPDVLIVGEPSGWDRVTVGFRGQRRGAFRATSVPGHASSPRPGALDECVDAAARLQAYVRGMPRRGIFATPGCRVLRWHHESRVDAEFAGFEVDLRTPPGFDWAALEAEAPGFRWSPPVAAVVVEKGNRAVRALVAAIREHCGTPEYVLKGGTSDMNHAARAWRIPMASYGPGDPNLDHGPEERLAFEEFRRSVGVLEETFRRLGASP